MNSSPKSSSPKKSSFNFKSSLENLESALNDDDGIHNLEVLKVLRLDGVCESLFFGKVSIIAAPVCVVLLLFLKYYIIIIVYSHHYYTFC